MDLKQDLLMLQLNDRRMSLMEKFKILEKNYKKQNFKVGIQDMNSLLFIINIFLQR